jgi:hypothetical protein
MIQQQTSNKDLNNRIVYDRLKKDFARFFNKELFSSVTSGGDKGGETFKDRSPIHADKTTGVFSPKFSFDQEQTMTVKSGKNTIE